MAGKCRITLYRRHLVEAEAVAADKIVAGMAPIGIYAAMQRVQQIQTVVR